MNEAEEEEEAEKWASEKQRALTPVHAALFLTTDKLRTIVERRRHTFNTQPGCPHVLMSSCPHVPHIFHTMLL